ncbi:MAG: hypothetical protein QW548_00860 [Candidatus Aenigmatarchaeota archaeon]
MPHQNGLALYLDAEKKVCKGHGTVKYLTCNVMPELLLIGEAKEPEHDLADLDCLEGASLSPEAQKKNLGNQFKICSGSHSGIGRARIRRNGWERSEAELKFGPGELDSRLCRFSEKAAAVIRKVHQKEPLSESESGIRDFLGRFLPHQKPCAEVP